MIPAFSADQQSIQLGLLKNKFESKVSSQPSFHFYKGEFDSLTSKLAKEDSRIICKKEEQNRNIDN